MADGSIIIDTKVDSTGAEKDIKGLGGKLGNMASKTLGSITKATAAMVSVAAGAVATLTTISIKQYAEYEQLIGGVETLFKDSSNQVMEYADNAYKTAGMTANEYMSTITGFSASLLQGLGGDTKKATEIGNLAVTDMADNANKMGTAMENIQNAYQGFAKGNYTMLDNLKLGYGGTKEEMQRLLRKAEELEGYMEGSLDISNFSDVIKAINIIQTDLGITGTTAKEAAETISGSFGMTKSSWGNLITGMSDDSADFDKLINNLVESVGTLASNLLPRIEIALNGVGKLIDKLLPEIVSRIPSIISSILPRLLTSGVNIVNSLLDGIRQSLPEIVTGAINIVTTLSQSLLNMLPEILSLGLDLIITLAKGIAESIPTLIPTIIDTVITICDTIIENIGMVVSVAIDIIMALIQGLIEALPTLIQEVPRIINEFSSAIYEQLPVILKAGIDILLMLIKGLIDSIPTLISNIPQIIMAIVNVFTLYNWWNLGKGVLTKIGEGIKGMKGSIVSTVKNVANNIITTITDVFQSGLNVGRYLIAWIKSGISNSISTVINTVKTFGSNVISSITRIFSGNALGIGKDLIRGIWSGISNMSGWILDKIGGFAGNIVSGIKGFFGIHSPSRIMRDLIGVNLVKGIGVGVDIETPNLEKDIVSNMSGVVAKMQNTVSLEASKMSEGAISSSHNVAFAGIPEGSTFVLENSLDGNSLGESIYKVVGNKLALISRGAR